MSQIELLQSSATAADELQINDSGDINLTPASTKDVNIPQNIGYLVVILKIRCR